MEYLVKISKSNSLRFAKRVDFSTVYKNDENTLSCEVDCRLPKKEILRYQTNDVIQNQFKSTFTTNVVKVLKEDLSEINIPVVKKTNNIGQKDKRDAQKFSYLQGGKAGIYFTQGNIYDFDTNDLTGTYDLGGRLPYWAVPGNNIIIDGVSKLIENVIFDETLNVDVVVLDGAYTMPSAPIIVSCVYNIEEYEVYEFSIDMALYIDQYIRISLISSNGGISEVEYISEIINIKLKQENTVEIKYRNTTNTDILFSSNIEFKIRQRLIFKNGIAFQASENYKTDTNVVLLSSDIYEGDEFIFEPTTKEKMRNIVAALSCDECFMDDIGYIKDSIDIDGPFGNTNLYQVKAKMIKSGVSYYPLTVIEPIVKEIFLQGFIRIDESADGNNFIYQVTFSKNFDLTSISTDISLDNFATFTTPAYLELGSYFVKISMPKTVDSFQIRLKDYNATIPETVVSNILNYEVLVPVIFSEIVWENTQTNENRTGTDTNSTVEILTILHDPADVVNKVWQTKLDNGNWIDSPYAASVVESLQNQLGVNFFRLKARNHQSNIFFSNILQYTKSNLPPTNSVVASSVTFGSGSPQNSNPVNSSAIGTLTITGGNFKFRVYCSIFTSNNTTAEITAGIDNNNIPLHNFLSGVGQTYSEWSSILGPGVYDYFLNTVINGTGGSGSAGIQWEEVL